MSNPPTLLVLVALSIAAVGCKKKTEKKTAIVTIDESRYEEFVKRMGDDLEKRLEAAAKLPDGPVRRMALAQLTPTSQTSLKARDRILKEMGLSAEQLITFLKTHPRKATLHARKLQLRIRAAALRSGLVKPMGPGSMKTPPAPAMKTPPAMASAMKPAP